MSDLLYEALEQAKREVYNINVANGWFEDDRRFAEDIALLHSEVSEMLEEYREWGEDGRLKFESAEGYSIVKEDDPNARNWLIKGAIPKPLGIGSEAADILIRLLDTCSRYNIDLAKEFWRKLEYNATRGYKHGGKLL